MVVLLVGQQLVIHLLFITLCCTVLSFVQDRFKILSPLKGNTLLLNAKVFLWWLGGKLVTILQLVHCSRLEKWVELFSDSFISFTACAE